MALAEDPALLVVEMNNENSVFMATPEDLAALPEPYQSSLLWQWRQWLHTRYATEQEIREAWSLRPELPGANLVKNSSFDATVSPWLVQTVQPVKAVVNLRPGGLNGSSALHALMHTKGPTSPSLVVLQDKITVEHGKEYTLSFDARSPTSMPLQIEARSSKPPHAYHGLQRLVPIGPAWKHYEFRFTAENPQGESGRLNFDFGGSPGEWWLDNIRLCAGATRYYKANARYSLRNTALVPLRSTASPIQLQDFRQFLFETEKKTTKELFEYLRNELKVQAFLVDSQPLFGDLPSMYREMELSDLVDMHLYWDIARSVQGVLDYQNWQISNIPLSADATGGSMTKLAMYRANDKPFSVSEYNHGSPGFYVSEMFPIYSSFASFQDWDAIYQYAYNIHLYNPLLSMIMNWLNLDGQPAQLAFVPFAAFVFRTGCFTTDQKPVTLALPEEPLAFLRQEKEWYMGYIWQAYGALAPSSLVVPRGLKVGTGNSQPVLELPETMNTPSPIEWTGGPNGFYKAVSSKAVALTGAVARQPGAYQAGPFTVTFYPTSNGYATFAAFAVDGLELERSRQVLVALANRVENTNMVWNETFTSTGPMWGYGPTICEAVTTTIAFTSERLLQVCALDGSGNPQSVLPASREGLRYSFSTGLRDRTLWFLLREAPQPARKTPRKTVLMSMDEQDESFGEDFEMPITDELDLHGFTPKEVRDVLREYLREAFKKNLLELRIVHGKGVGVQRNIVQAELARNPLVESFRDGTATEGGLGATVVKLDANAKLEGDGE